MIESCVHPACNAAPITPSSVGASAARLPAQITPDMSLTLRQLVDALTMELAYQKSPAGVRDIERVATLMRSWDSSDPSAWTKYALFDEEKCYTRNLIASDKVNFTLMMLCWNKGKTSIIHDHSNSECWVRVVQGDCLEERFLQAGDDAPLVQESLTTYPAGAVTHISDKIGLHRLGNASNDDVLITLHCYSPPFSTCKVFPDKTGHGVPITMSFYSEDGVKADCPTPAGSTSTKTLPAACAN
ncbi:Cysteine dioxygenase [Plasmodiophora brassicae]